MSGVAWAVFVVPKIDPAPTDKWYACVSSAGKVKPATMKLNVQPANCPAATDTIRWWAAQGPQGPKGDAGTQGPAFATSRDGDSVQLVAGTNGALVPRLVASLTLPPGRYVLQGKVQLTANLPGQRTSAECELSNGPSTLLDGGFGGADWAFQTLLIGADYAAPLSLTGSGELTTSNNSPATVQLWCSGRVTFPPSQPAGTPLMSVLSADMTAIQVGQLTKTVGSLGP